MKTRPLYDRIIVKRKDAESTTASGIIIPDSAKEKPLEGVVVSVGKGRLINDEILPLYVKLGDRILFGAYAGNEIKIDNDDYLIMKEADVLCIIDQDD